jgi:hypothetical protein
MQSFSPRDAIAMKSSRFESETSGLFEFENALERVDLKNVIELSVLRREAAPEATKNLNERAMLRRD